MHFKYQITEKEFKDFSYYTAWGSPGKKQNRLNYYIINIFIYSAGLLILFMVSARTLHISSVGSIAIILMMWLVLFFFFRFRVKNKLDRYVERTLKESGKERMLPSQELNVEESGISATTNDSDVNFKWTAIFKKVEVNNCYYLYISSVQAIIIPVRIFSSSKEKEEFGKLLLMHLPSTAKAENL
jgi:hypothetical protein